MKIYNLIGVLLLISATCLLSACNKSEIVITGEYEFEDVIYVGGVSSLTINGLREMNATKKYIIENDSFSIINNDSKTLFSNVSYEKEKLNKESTNAMYGDINKRLMNIFDKFETRFRYSIYDEQGKKINYCIYLMDDEIFISRFAKKDNILFSIDKLKKID